MKINHIKDKNYYEITNRIYETTYVFANLLFVCVDALRPRQNGRQIPDDNFKCIFWMKIYKFKISLKFGPKGPINNIPALVQIMAWHRQGDKLLSEPMMDNSLTHICVTQHQWGKRFPNLFWHSLRHIKCPRMIHATFYITLDFKSFEPFSCLHW